jgi:hypothetical protein
MELQFTDKFTLDNFKKSNHRELLSILLKEERILDENFNIENYITFYPYYKGFYFFYYDSSIPFDVEFYYYVWTVTDEDTTHKVLEIEATNFWADVRYCPIKVANWLLKNEFITVQQ